MSVSSTAHVHGPRWGARAEAWAELAATITRPAWEAVADAARIGRGTRVLDVGCGSGEFCRLAIARGALVSGIDAAQGMIDVARRAAPDAELLVGPIEALPWGDDAFDVVTGFNSLQFAADVIAALREARRVTRPGGLVAVCQWDDGYPNDVPRVTAGVRALLPQMAPAQPSPPVEAALEGAGLAVERKGEVDTPLVAPDLETLVRALMSPGPVSVAIEHAGEDAVRGAIAEGAEPFRQADGSYRLANRFRYAIARA